MLRISLRRTPVRAAVAAYSKLTSKTELSTHEAELAALEFSRVNAEEVAQILREVGLLKEGPIVLYCDNDSVHGGRRPSHA